jgi:NAD(P)-dependent dehydrogenase (short-subunit alcohol dehydrogenase family)
MKHPICLITGATEGVGKVTALELAKKGFTIVIAARNADKAGLPEHPAPDARGELSQSEVAFLEEAGVDPADFAPRHRGANESSQR